MTRQLVPRELLDSVVSYFNPHRVILFGSTARGDAGPDSDIDLLVVVDDDTPTEILSLRAGYEASRTCRRHADVFPMRAEIFERNCKITGTLAAEADNEGIVVYGSPKGLATVKATDRHARWEVVERWLAIAELDRQTVTACMAADPPLRASAAFHCQQAVEKLLKGFLVLAAKRFRKTHSLAQLGAAVQASFPELAGLVTAVEEWTVWAVAYRYPLEEGPDDAKPDDEELRRALATIDTLASLLRAAKPQDSQLPASK
jgi:predicted nucleotidyltransferase/HEPN domain-containing protein